jgi:hypothetical protein
MVVNTSSRQDNTANFEKYSQESGLQGDEFSQTIAMLPAALRNLNRQFLQLLVQDEANVVFILNNDGEVDQGRLEELRLKLMPEGRERDDKSGFYNQPQPHTQGFNGGAGQRPNQGMQGDFAPPNRQQHKGPGARKRSRFSVRDDLSHQPDVGGQAQFQDPMQPMHTSYRDQGRQDQGSYGPVGQDMHQMPLAMDDNQQAYNQYQQPPDAYDPHFNSDQRRRNELQRDEQQKKFPTTKAAAPCRFFNTRKGCQFGDDCPFGHFMEDTSAAPSGMRAPESGPSSYSPRGGEPANMGPSTYGPRGDNPAGRGGDHTNLGSTYGPRGENQASSGPRGEDPTNLGSSTYGPRGENSVGSDSRGGNSSNCRPRGGDPVGRGHSSYGPRGGDSDRPRQSPGGKRSGRGNRR